MGDTRSYIINAANILVGLFITIVGVIRLLQGFQLLGDGGFQLVVIAIYLIIFGAFIIVLEIVFIQALGTLILFWWSWAGRGFSYLFLGVLILSPAAFDVIAGIVVIAIAFIYILFQCLKAYVGTLPPPLTGSGGSFIKTSPSGATTAV